MLRRLAAVLGCFFLWSGTVAADDGWRLYRNEALGVSVEMPGEAKISTRTLSAADGPVLVTQASVEVSSAEYYALAVSDRTGPGVPYSDAALDGVLAAAVGAAPGGKVISSRHLTLDGYPALEAEVFVGSNGLTLRLLMAARERRLYQLASTFRGGPAPGARRMEASLHLF